uniref:Uncharacterized protein n=1 Tax=Rhizophora mucronata TaxID=61149 RepID=A0A2P2N3W0_RHIMU
MCDICENLIDSPCNPLSAIKNIFTTNSIKEALLCCLRFTICMT